MGKFKYFELSEFIKSRTATERGIDNTPTFQVVDNLSELVEAILDPLRAAWGKPIRVSSGYRCAKLNDAVGGAETSVHMKGLAADLQPTSGSFNEFRDFCVEWFRKTGVKFDQLLLERNSKTGACWIHVGLYNNTWQQRGQVKVMEAGR